MQNMKGRDFERKIFILINGLEEVGLAKSIKLQDHVTDRDGNQRKIDLTFILCTNLVEINITVECKSKTRTISLDDIDQIKTFKNELPERNVFWFIYEGTINDNVRKSLRAKGISYYSYTQFEQIVKSILKKYSKLKGKIDSSKSVATMLSMMNPVAYGYAVYKTHEYLYKCFVSADEVYHLMRTKIRYR